MITLYSFQVQVGNTIVAYVRLLDNRDVPFPSDQHWLMKLQASPKTEHIEVKYVINFICTCTCICLEHSNLFKN